MIKIECPSCQEELRDPNDLFVSPLTHETVHAECAILHWQSYANGLKVEINSLKKKLSAYTTPERIAQIVRNIENGKVYTLDVKDLPFEEVQNIMKEIIKSHETSNSL